MKDTTKAEIMKRAKGIKNNGPEEKPQVQPKRKTDLEIINEADENFFMDRLLELNTAQLHNTRLAIKRLMKEGQLLRNVKKKWNS